MKPEEEQTMRKLLSRSGFSDMDMKVVELFAEYSTVFTGSQFEVIVEMLKEAARVSLESCNFYTTQHQALIHAGGASGLSRMATLFEEIRNEHALFGMVRMEE